MKNKFWLVRERGGNIEECTEDSGEKHNTSRTPKANSATTKNWREQQTQPIRNKEKMKNRFWLARERGGEVGECTEDTGEQQLATLAATQ
jgi:hypothetical protein